MCLFGYKDRVRDVVDQIQQVKRNFDLSLKIDIAIFEMRAEISDLKKEIESLKNQKNKKRR